MISSCSSPRHIKEGHQLLALLYRGNPCSLVPNHNTCTRSHSGSHAEVWQIDRHWIPVWKGPCAGSKYQEALHLLKHSTEGDFSLQIPGHPANGKDEHYWLATQHIKYVQLRNLIYFVHSLLQLTRSVKYPCMLNQPEWVYQHARD